MSSPPPPDPYQALGVPPSSDIAAIRSAHRKLVLKHHPDRIQDPALKEKGKDAFQKIQQAYEILSDPVKRSRYDDQVKLAALRKEAVMRDCPTPTRSQTYPTRPAPSRESAPREFNADDNAFYETRKPRHEDFGSSRERFEEPLRTSSRKYQDYDRAASAKKTAEKERTETSARSHWAKARTAVNVGLRMKKEAEKARSSRTKETKERERKNERSEKDTRTRAVYHSEDSDSDTATHVTSSTIKPSRSSARHTPQSSTSRPSTANRRPAYGDESEESDSARKWESSFDKTKEYIEKAAAGAGKRPPFDRHESGSFWSSTLRSGSDSDRRPTSSKGRHSYEDESPRSRPAMPTQNSAPSGVKARMEERTPSKADRRSGASASYSPREREDHKPTLNRSQTMPAQTSSKKNAAPKNSSNLKHTETHDSGYGSSSSPHTPDPREDSPVRRTTKSRYTIVDPDSEDDRASRIHRVYDDDTDRRRRYASPEPISEKRPTQRPRGSTAQSHTRSKPSRDSPAEPKLRRAESSREGTSDKYYNSSREKLHGEMDEPFEREPRGYKYSSGEKTSVRSPRAESFARYDDVRTRDFAPGSRFQADARGSRRPSVQGF